MPTEEHAHESHSAASRPAGVWSLRWAFAFMMVAALDDSEVQQLLDASLIRPASSSGGGRSVEASCRAMVLHFCLTACRMYYPDKLQSIPLGRDRPEFTPGTSWRTISSCMQNMDRFLLGYTREKKGKNKYCLRWCAAAFIDRDEQATASEKLRDTFWSFTGASRAADVVVMFFVDDGEPAETRDMPPAHKQCSVEQANMFVLANAREMARREVHVGSTLVHA